MPSITRRAKPRAPVPAANVEELLLGAMERLLAAGQSFTSVSVEELAREAGIARSTFYLHFRDKGELVQALMQRVMSEVLAAVAGWLSGPQLADRADLRSAISGVVHAYQQHRAVMLAAVETAAYDAEVARIFYDKMNVMALQTRQAIEGVARAKGATVPLPEVSDVLVWALERSCHQLLGNKTPAQVERVIDALTHVSWHALYAPDALGAPATKPRRAKA
jgi:AcrR family transcriptional regulator